MDISIWKKCVSIYNTSLRF